MSKVKLLLDLVADIRSVADDLEALSNCFSSADHSTAEEAKLIETIPSPVISNPAAQGLAPNERIDEETGEIIRLDLPTLRAQTAAKANTKERTNQIKALLQKHGVSKLTELPLTDYFIFQEEVAAIE